MIATGISIICHSLRTAILASRVRGESVTYCGKWKELGVDQAKRLTEY
jgi:hypothetical protein